MKLCFASGNKHKIEEIKALVPSTIEIISLKDIGINHDLPENGTTLEENSLEKSQKIWDDYQISCFSDDSGLEVFSLNNEPGVFSSRYAGNHCSPDDNIKLLLQKLKDKPDKSARFRTVITLILAGKMFQFEGIVSGKIINTKKGFFGFGYDPIFIPDGYDETFAEMDISLKNQISHRKKAIDKLITFLEN